MAKGKNSIIYTITLDDSQFKKATKAAESNLKKVEKQTDKTKKSIDKLETSTKTLAKSINNYVVSANKHLAKFAKTVSGLNTSIRALDKNIGSLDAKLKALRDSARDLNTNINPLVRSTRGLRAALGATARNATQAKNSMGKFSGALGTSATVIEQRAQKIEASANQMAGAIKNAGEQARQSNRQIKNFGSNYRANMNGGSGQRGGGGYSSRLGNVTNAMGSVWLGMELGRALIVDWQRSIASANGELERSIQLMKNFSKELTEEGRLEDAKKNVDDMVNMAQNSPYSVNALTDTFVKLQTSGMQPVIDGFGALVDGAAAYGKTEEELKRAGVAIQQMAGKGVVSMEELRQQLGEAIPGAINIMARGMGMTYAELVKEVSQGKVKSEPALTAMMRQLQIEFMGSAEAMMLTYDGLVAKFKTGITKSMWTFGDVDDQNGYMSEVKTMLREFTAIMETANFQSMMKSIGDVMGSVVNVFAEAVKGAIKYKDEIAAIATMITALIGTKLVFWMGSSVVGAFAAARKAVVAYNAALAITIARYKVLTARQGLSMVASLGKLAPRLLALAGPIVGLTAVVGAATYSWHKYKKSIEDSLEIAEKGFDVSESISAVEKQIALNEAEGKSALKLKKELEDLKEVRESGHANVTQNTFDLNKSRIDELTSWNEKYGATNPERKLENDAEIARRIANEKRMLSILAKPQAQIEFSEENSAVINAAQTEVTILGNKLKELAELQEKEKKSLKEHGRDKRDLVEASAKKQLAIYQEGVDNQKAALEKANADLKKAETKSAGGATNQVYAMGSSSSPTAKNQNKKNISKLALAAAKEAEKLKLAQKSLEDRKAAIEAVLADDDFFDGKYGEESTWSVDPKGGSKQPIMPSQYDIWITRTNTALAKHIAKVDEANEKKAEFISLQSSGAFKGMNVEPGSENYQKGLDLAEEVWGLTQMNKASASAESSLKTLNVELAKLGSQNKGRTNQLLKPIASFDKQIEKYKGEVEELEKIMSENRKRLQDNSDRFSYEGIEAYNARLEELKKKADDAREAINKLSQLRVEALTSSFQNLDRQLRNKIDPAGLSDLELKLMDVDYALKEIGREFDQTTPKGQAAFKALKDSAERYKKTLSDADKLNKNHIKKTMQDWEVSAENVNKIGASAVTGFVDTLASGLARGELSFQGFCDSIREMIIKLMIQDLVKKFFTSMGWFGLGEGGATGGGLSGSADPGGGSGIVIRSMPAVSEDYSMPAVSAANQSYANYANYANMRAAPSAINSVDSVQAMSSVAPKSATPNVSVNMINQTGQSITGQQSGGMKFDGEKYVLDIVMKAAGRPGQFRSALQST